jgi:hypothetical protein
MKIVFDFSKTKEFKVLVEGTPYVFTENYIEEFFSLFKEKGWELHSCDFDAVVGKGSYTGIKNAVLFANLLTWYTSDYKELQRVVPKYSSAPNIHISDKNTIK